jgi:hypothetical protein
MAFDYTDSNNDEAARAVAAEMTNSELRPLSESEWLERQAWREECHRRDREMHEEYLAAQAAKEAVAERERAIAAKAERDRAQRERTREIERQVTQQSLSQLRMSAARQDRFANSVAAAHRNAQAYAARQTILSELEAMISPPQPTEPTIVHVTADDNDDDNFCGVKITRPNPRRSWW